MPNISRYNAAIYRVTQNSRSFTKDLTASKAEQALNILKRILNRLYEEKNKINSEDD
ncbi:hypothetical protein Desaci_2760 [Desulfosporosinus acidiphilus SJ4]|uniref:Uncharacterized protein n=1 Tax=Desulfosporosinus acidiphilus (strain DSM 22704 / JCM 16185 / SJ4) TaxID=646529 RepID=I4D7B1_DESAJ|nr:hypothetical protein [Desulfosporosinus acidiphilus]AFM41685.1 hypothetical protein Desaci_2760 [Desulfosporosinus acidiphilus SJ4]